MSGGLGGGGFGGPQGLTSGPGNAGQGLVQAGVELAPHLMSKPGRPHFKKPPVVDPEEERARAAERARIAAIRAKSGIGHSDLYAGFGSAPPTSGKKSLLGD